MRFKNIIFFLFFTSLFSCKEPEARRPKTTSTTSFYKEVITKNKQIITQENRFIENFIKKDTTKTYHASTKSFWYFYNIKIDKNLPKPKAEDIVEIEFNITGFNGNEIYPKQKKTYKIDKEDFIPALDDGIKLMKKGEMITFVIPSHRAYGVAGDENKIKGNETIKSTVTLIDIN